jgi:hypothetical protein
MAYESPQALSIGTLTAAADLSAKQYHFVKLASATTVNVCSAVTDVPIGVLQNNPTSGKSAEVLLLGVSKVVADDTLAAGDVIGTSADAQAQPLTVGTETTVYTCGQAITAGSAGDTVTAFINISNGRAS